MFAVLAFRCIRITGIAAGPVAVHAAAVVPATCVLAQVATQRADIADLRDGLRLEGAYITATARCAPPANKPTPVEMARCRPFLLEELGLLARVRVVVALGKIGWDAYLRARREAGLAVPRPLPRFGHGAVAAMPDGGPALLGCFHPSQQNTFTGKLTRAMLRAVFVRARRLAIPQASRRGET
jgi:uracil-DNA glycosylase